MNMDTMTSNNGQYNNKTFPKKARTKTSTFSQVVLKSDVGEFQDGIFVAAEPINLPQHRTKNYHKTTERPTLERPKSEGSLHGRPNQREHSHSNPNPSHHNNYVQYVPPSGDRNVSPVRLTSPARSPNRRHSPPQSGYADHPANPHTLSPPKHRKPPQEKLVERPEGSERGGSPPKSPAPSRWAGPAFSNAPPPSSLPIPDFPPFTPSPPTSSSSSPSSSPPPAPINTQPLFHVPSHSAPVYEPYVYSHPSAYYQLPQHPAYFSSYAYAQSAHSVEELSMGLRQMLHLEQPVTPILA